MALEVAEGAVVGDDLEAVAQRLEAAAGAVAAVGALAHQRRQQLRPLGAVEDVDAGEDLGLRCAGGLEQAGGEQVLFGAVDMDQLDRGGILTAAATVEAEAGDPALGLGAALLKVGDPLAAAVGAIDPGDEARHHLLQLRQDHAAVLARLRQRRGHQPQDQLLVGLAGGVDADVAERRRRQQAAQQVQRLGPDRALPGALGLAVAARPALGRPGLDFGQRARVDPEQLVHRLRRTAVPAPRCGRSGSRLRAAACRRGCSGSTAPGRRRGGRAAAAW